MLSTRETAAAAAKMRCAKMSAASCHVATAAMRLENELSSTQYVGGYYAGSLNDPNAQQAEMMLWTDTGNPTTTYFWYDSTRGGLQSGAPTATSGSVGSAGAMCVAGSAGTAVALS